MDLLDHHVVADVAVVARGAAVIRQVGGGRLVEPVVLGLGEGLAARRLFLHRVAAGVEPFLAGERVAHGTGVRVYRVDLVFVGPPLAVDVALAPPHQVARRHAAMVAVHLGHLAEVVMGVFGDVDGGAVVHPCLGHLAGYVRNIHWTKKHLFHEIQRDMICKNLHSSNSPFHLTPTLRMISET